MNRLHKNTRNWKIKSRRKKYYRIYDQIIDRKVKKIKQKQTNKQTNINKHAQT